KAAVCAALSAVLAAGQAAPLWAAVSRPGAAPGAPAAVHLAPPAVGADMQAGAQLSPAARSSFISGILPDLAPATPAPASAEAGAQTPVAAAGAAAGAPASPESPIDAASAAQPGVPGSAEPAAAPEAEKTAPAGARAARVLDSLKGTLGLAAKPAETGASPGSGALFDGASRRPPSLFRRAAAVLLAASLLLPLAGSTANSQIIHTPGQGHIPGQPRLPHLIPGPRPQQLPPQGPPDSFQQFQPPVKLGSSGDAGSSSPAPKAPPAPAPSSSASEDTPLSRFLDAARELLKENEKLEPARQIPPVPAPPVLPVLTRPDEWYWGQLPVPSPFRKAEKIISAAPKLAGGETLRTYPDSRPPSLDGRGSPVSILRALAGHESGKSPGYEKDSYNGVEYVHLYDGKAHWYGFGADDNPWGDVDRVRVKGLAQHWMRYHEGRVWWLDSANGRWLYADANGVWWYQDPARPEDVHLYQDGVYYRYQYLEANAKEHDRAARERKGAVLTPNRLPPGHDVPASVAATPRLLFYSDDGSRIVEVYGKTNAYLFDGRRKNARGEPLYIGRLDFSPRLVSAIDDVRFVYDDEGRLSRIRLTWMSDSWATFDVNGSQRVN
ncbi:MAG TPA: hypothetical protein VNI01_00195, partial [Elusimicrobiota bacterium]|nr:hypothetical protein [Elusimicrobiota bacterium]